MSQVVINETGCVVTVSHITGDVLCRWPGAECNCLMQKVDDSYAVCSGHSDDEDCSINPQDPCEACIERGNA